MSTHFERKGQSPFYPGQPVPEELFVGRREEFGRLERALRQVAAGKPQAVFILGEYGIGKSSLARYVRATAEKRWDVVGFHALLGTAQSLEDVSVSVVRAVIEHGGDKPGATQAIRTFLAKYIGEQQLFGVTLRFDKLREDAPDFSRGFLPLLRNIRDEVREDYRGVMLILDEINGMAARPEFARFLKSFWDENAVGDRPLPLLLVLCGTEERYREIVEKHEPVARIFDLVRVGAMSDAEMREFFTRAFGKAGIRIEEAAMEVLCRFSGGLPKFMHLLGDAAYWRCDEPALKQVVALQAVVDAAEEVGRRFVDQQVYKALHSKDYRGILSKLVAEDFATRFAKADVEKKLTAEEKRKFGDFLQRMVKLGVLVHGENRGEYAFRDKLTRLYIRFVETEKTQR